MKKFLLVFVFLTIIASLAYCQELASEVSDTEADLKGEYNLSINLGLMAGEINELVYHYQAIDNKKIGSILVWPLFSFVPIDINFEVKKKLLNLTPTFL